MTPTFNSRYPKSDWPTRLFRGLIIAQDIGTLVDREGGRRKVDKD